jgi:acyl-CoA dehydrogenase
VTATAAQLQDATLWLMQNGMADPNNAGAAAHDYLNLAALTTLAFMWAMMAKTAQEKLANGADDKAFYENKLVTARFFINRILPDAQAHLAKLKSGAGALMALSADAF